MERREFLAAVPAAAVGLSWAGSAGAQTDADPLPGFQPPGSQRWERSDFQAGDRPVGASFGSRSEVFGRAGPDGTSPPTPPPPCLNTRGRGGSDRKRGVEG